MKLSFCPAVPLKVRLAFCPAARFPVAGTRVAGPVVPGAGTVNVPVKSAATAASFRVSLPKPVEECWAHTWYVPPPASCLSTKNVCPAGLLLICVLASTETEGDPTFSMAEGFVTFVAVTLMCCAVVVVKLKRTSCPATVVFAVTALPPIEIAGVATS